MTLDYEQINREIEENFAKERPRLIENHFAKLYGSRTHFIFELLQNTEDALKRHPREWQGSRAISFDLTKTELRIRHFGSPFTRDDFKAICSIGDSNKPNEKIRPIGRFGIGFKSVYLFSKRPEIHSGSSHYAIENYGSLTPAGPLPKEDEETVIVLPFKSSDVDWYSEIADGLEKLGTSTLLFLRQIEEVRWSVKGGKFGHYTRKLEDISKSIHRVTVIGQICDEIEIAEDWLVFSRQVNAENGYTGYVEIAFSIVQDGQSKCLSIQPIKDSRLVVFFPTIVETDLGFRMQGPYETTPSREGIEDSQWNDYLVCETALLLKETLRWLRDHKLLNTTALHCLPLDAKYDKFAPLFEAIKESLLSEPLLPRFDGGYVQATQARLGSTQAIRKCFTPAQLTALYGKEGELAWLSDAITSNSTPVLHLYIRDKLGVAEITPDTIVSLLRNKQSFLEAQSDDWLINIYEFFSGQQRQEFRHRLNDVPLIRLEDGRHVRPQAKGEPQAFLPSGASDYAKLPTVRASICENEVARKFLKSLGIRKVDPVDEVICNVLPKYRVNNIDINDAKYEDDIQFISTAFGTDSRSQRERLTDALKSTPFIRTVDTGDCSKQFSKPDEVYLATKRLKNLFNGVKSVHIVDDSYRCLCGKKIRALLDACGVIGYLRPVQHDSPSSLSHEERERLRNQAGHPQTSSQNDRVSNWKLAGLENLLKMFSSLTKEEQANKAKCLWEELALLKNYRGMSIFEGKYSWSHYGNYQQSFDADFVKTLNATAWIPDENGELQLPRYVYFETLRDTHGWEEDPILVSKIQFKRPIISELALAADIELEALDLIQKHGVTASKLREWLGVNNDPVPKSPMQKSTPNSPETEINTGVNNDKPNNKPLSYSDALAKLKKQKQRIQENQNLGKRVEKLVRESLENKGFAVKREPIGLDFEISAKTDGVATLELTSKKKREKSWLIEVKATRGQKEVRMTATQARKAVEQRERFLLCVVPVGDSTPDLDTVQANMRFVENIGDRVDQLCKGLDRLKALRKEITADKSPDIQLKVEDGTPRIRVFSSVWENDGFPLKDLAEQLSQ